MYLRRLIQSTGSNLLLRSTTSRPLSSQAAAAAGDDDAPANEPILDYSQDDSTNRLELQKAFNEFQANPYDVPIVINGKEFRTDNVRYQRCPFEHHKKVAKFYYASHELIDEAIKAALAARKEWEFVPLKRKVQIFERAAQLISGKYRFQLNAATMFGQAKTAKQAEIDSACELVDFFRFNNHYMRKLAQSQPRSTQFELNSLEFRGLDGFVAAISPFNFTAIAGNLVQAPALASNCVVWKPSDTAVLSNYLILKVLQEAGLPDGVINFVPSEGLDFGRLVTSNKHLAGVNFTGSLTTFQWLWSEVGLNVKRYASFPRLVGECGGKNFHFIHKSAHLETAVVQTIRSAFEYSGQKCSACSRLYVPASLWRSHIRAALIDFCRTKLKLGPANESASFTSAVIDENSFKRCKSYIDYARAIDKDQVEILTGGGCSQEVGYYVEPTIIETKNPRNRLMFEEIFGPILSVYVYPDSEVDRTLELIDEHPFALTGAIFAQDEQFIQHAKDKLRMSAGNFYINDKSTGAVVGQQPFGGSRHSGTNDKAGGPFHMLRWLNQQTVKRTTRELTEL